MTWAGRSGQMLRFVVGADAPPQHAFFAPEAPVFTCVDDSGTFALEGDRFTVRDSDVVLRGMVRHEPWALDFDTGDAEIYGFGSAAGGPVRNRERFRVMTLDTIFMGIEVRRTQRSPCSSCTAQRQPRRCSWPRRSRSTSMSATAR